MFDRVGEIVEEAQSALARGENERLGALMTRNQKLLEEMGVSSPEIERLVEAGVRGGRRGGNCPEGDAGKCDFLCGGRGGEVMERVRDVLMEGGAKGVTVTRIGE